jgi:hypothetical protein
MPLSGLPTSGRWRYSWSDGAYDSPTTAPSGDRSLATVWPQGSLVRRAVVGIPAIEVPPHLRHFVSGRYLELQARLWHGDVVGP